MEFMRSIQHNAHARQNFKIILDQDDVFSAFSEQTKQLFLAQATFQRYLPEQMILQQQQCADDLSVLVSGTVQTGWLQADGQFKIHQYFTQKSAFNLAALIQHQPLSYDYFAVDRVEVAVLSGELFFKELKQQPEALWQLLTLMTKRMYQQFQQNHYLKAGDLKQRIAHHLVSLIPSQTIIQNNQCTLEFKLNQHIFANMFNVSRQTLNKQIQSLQQQQILQWNQGNIKILDVNTLKKISELN